jgi:hypothetical protein
MLFESASPFRLPSILTIAYKCGLSANSAQFLRLYALLCTSEKASVNNPVAKEIPFFESGIRLTRDAMFFMA